jgi:maltose alpha-D-glucosyltransferase/alpha-amylase
LLVSMPGSPVLYYGDEIGMGDNIHLGDRDGVRTPMQWTSDRNGGFSTASFEELYLPPLMDPVYGFEALNVESQQRNPGSFLHWIRRLLLRRRQHPQLATGSYTPVPCDNRAILAYVRGGVESAPNDVLCVTNLHRAAQPAMLDLTAWKGAVPVEALGGVSFPPIAGEPYQLSLPPHGFFWFELRPA